MTVVSRISAFRRWDNFVFRPITMDDTETITAIYSLCFGIKPSEKYIRWRYLETLAGVSPTMLAFDKEICVGSYGVWPTKLLLDGKQILGAQAIDSMTHPQYRGRGIFVEVAERCYRVLNQHGYQVLYGFPNDSAYPGRIRRLNWDHVSDIHHWVRPIWFLGTSYLGGLTAATSLFRRSSATIHGLHALTQPPDQDALAAMLRESVETRDICRVERSSQWFAWRYHADSGRNYQWISLYSGAVLKAVGIWRFDPVARRALLGELLGNPQTFPAVLNCALSAAYQCRASMLDVFTNDPELLPLLRSKGFIRRSAERFMVRSLTGMTLPANIHWPQAWRIFGGDFDFF
jgi:Acetyltransferase (GNAT) domain